MNDTNTSVNTLYIGPYRAQLAAFAENPNSISIDRRTGEISEGTFSLNQAQDIDLLTNSEILFRAVEIIKDENSSKKHELRDELAKKVAEYGKVRLGEPLTQWKKATLAEGFELLALAEKLKELKELKELYEKLSNFKIPIHQSRLIDQFQAYTQKRSHSLDIEGACHGLTLDNLHSAFTEGLDDFFASLTKASSTDVSQIKDDLLNMPYSQLGKTPKLFEGLINDILSLQYDPRTKNQLDPISLLQFLSNHSNIQNLKSAYRICSLFTYENGSYRSLEKLISNILTCDKSKRKYLLMSTGNHSLGIYYNGSKIALYDSNDPYPQDRIYPMSKENIHHLVEEMTTRIKAEKRPVALGINVISDQTLYKGNFIDHPEEYLQSGTSFNGYTPLYIASQNGFFEAVEVLTEMEANVDHPGPEGTTSLWKATLNGDAAIVEMLLKAGADVNLADPIIISPLLVAVQKRQFDIVKLLIEHKADVNLATKYGDSPLGIAAQHGYTEVVKALIEAGADVNHVNELGYAPLHLASLEGHAETVNLLLGAKAKIDIKDKCGFTPRDLALYTEHLEIAKQLLITGVNEGYTLV